MSSSRLKSQLQLPVVNEQRAIRPLDYEEPEEPKSKEKTKEEETVKRVLFKTVTIYHFNRTQGFLCIPSQGGSTLGMKRRHFSRRDFSVDLFEEVKGRIRREILIKNEMKKRKIKRCDENNSTQNVITSDSISDLSDSSNLDLDSGNYALCRPIGVKLRRSLLKASGVSQFDANERKDCKNIRDSRGRSGCNCVNRCLPELCDCSQLGVNCYVDRASFPCGCTSSGCQNPAGRIEFDSKRVKEHITEKLFKVGIG